MDYQQTIKYLYDNLPMFHRIGPAALKNNLDNTFALDDSYNHPHRHYKTIHVAGTNGKGSVSHMLSAILQSAGYKTGLFTSPHLKDFRERIRVNGEMIEEKNVVKFVEEYINKNKILNLQTSFFELTTCMALDHFKNEEVDVAVIEVGLGGRLDSTNIITPELSVITNISYDHTSILGNTLQKIAGEKAGIIKPMIPVVIGETQIETTDIFTEKARETNSPILFADKRYMVIQKEDGSFTYNLSINSDPIPTDIGLKGIYQQKNLATVLSSVDILRERGFIIDEISLKDGLKNVVPLTGIQGRWQQMGENPKIICDTGHNEGGIRQIIAQLRNEKYDQLHLVFGMVNDKDVDSVLSLLPVDAVYYFTKASIERALNENILMGKAASYGLKGSSYSTVQEAYATARRNAGKNDLIFVGGSTFVVAEVV